MLETESTVAAPAASGTLRRFYAYRLISAAIFDSAVWIIYLQSRGYSLAEIGLAESAFHLAPILFELPSGSFADLVGRRWSLAIGSGLVALSTILLWMAPSLPVVMLALFLSGASYSFRSGSDQAYLYDALAATPEGGQRYVGVLGKLLGAAYVVSAGAAWLGAALSEIDFGLTFGLMIAGGLAGLWLAAGLAEARPRREEAVGIGASVRAHVREARAALANRPLVLLMMLLSALFWAANTIAHLYLPAAFVARGLSNQAVGLIYAVTLLLNAGGAALVGRVAGRGRFSLQFALLAGIVGLGLAGTAAEALVIAIGAYLLAQLGTGVVEPLVINWFNRQIPPAQRATILSLDSWAFSLIMIGAFPAAGLLADRLGWGVLFIGCGGVTLLLGAVVLVGLRVRRPPFADEGGVEER